MRQLPSILPYLRRYGCTDEPDLVAYGDWKPIHAICHDDRTRSARTDGYGYQCFTCDLFYPTAYQLVMERDGVNFAEARKRVHALAGEGDGGVRGERGRDGRYIPGGSRDYGNDRSFLPPRRRR